MTLKEIKKELGPVLVADIERIHQWFIHIRGWHDLNESYEVAYRYKKFREGKCSVRGS